MSYICRNKTVYFHGEEKGVVQDYLLIRKKMLEANELFEDEQFPANMYSLYRKKPDNTPTLIWKRPSEFTKDKPRFIVDGMSRFDVVQGNLGNCWVLAAMANLPTNKELWNFVVPQEQSFQEGYAGVFHFRFWRQGRWIDVVIDDRLPTTRGELYYAKSAVKNEFWSALLEKAYAKMFGSYEKLEGGETIESMIDLSGGVPEVYHLKEQNPKKLFSILRKECNKNCWLTCSTNAASKAETEEMERKYGIMPGHAYTMVAIAKVKFNDKERKQELVRMRNPWGSELEWKGAYRECSSEWDQVSEPDRLTLKLDCESDGEFWMHFQDFMRHFSNVEMCHLSSDILRVMPNEFGSKRLIVYHGSWSIKDGTAGGNLQNKDSFKKNPRYIVPYEDIVDCQCHSDGDGDSDDEKDAAASKRKCTMIVSVMQKNTRHFGMSPRTIGFYVYLIPDKSRDDPMLNHILDSREPLYQSKFQGWYREVSARLILETGTYLIVPSTDANNLEAEFMIRILTDMPVESAEFY